MQHFTRRETVILTRTSHARLAYLAKTGVVVPSPTRPPAAPQVHYTWEQILELRAIRDLRRQVSLQTIRKILAFLEGTGCDRALHDKHLIIANGEVSWVQVRGNTEPQVVRVAAKADCHVGQLQLMTLPSLRELTHEVWDTAQCSKVIDFESFRRRVVPFRPRG
ncbi:MAG: hypothetical protein ACFBSG_02345 [Leptolyngbyaceae cyanobacterium]